MRRDVFVDGIELRVIGHDELAVPIFDLHADVLPDLHRHRTFVKVLIDLLDGVRSKCRTIKLVRIKCRTESHVAAAGAYKRPCILDLRPQFLTVRQRVIHDEDVEQFQIQSFEH